MQETESRAVPYHYLHWAHYRFSRARPGRRVNTERGEPRTPPLHSLLPATQQPAQVGLKGEILFMLVDVVCLDK